MISNNKGGCVLLLACFACGSSDSEATGGSQGKSTNGEFVGSQTGFGQGNSVSSGPAVNTCKADDCVKEGEQQPCDGGLAIDGLDAMDGAKAIGLCKQALGTSWGVVSASYLTSHGAPLSGRLALGTGILNGFGPAITPREGTQMLALSSGAARTPSDPGYEPPTGTEKSNGEPHAWPTGFTLQESPKCMGVSTGQPYDSAMLEVKVKTPSNAKSLSFNLDFYTYEFPRYMCTEFNDYFVALMTPAPAGAIQGNISFDAMGNFISVNAGFLKACDPQTAINGEFFPCALGYGEILGTGYDAPFNQDFPPAEGNDSAATSWLETVAPIDAPGSEITLRFAIWDSSDEILDSTTLIDNFRFSLDLVTTGTTPVPK